MATLPRTTGHVVSIPVGFDSTTNAGNVGSIYEWDRRTLVVSESHRRLPNGSWSGGGPFYQVSDRLWHGKGLVIPKWYDWGIGGSGLHLRGVRPLSALTYDSAISSVHDWEAVRQDLYRYWATGYRKVRPGNPEASLFQFLVELKDLPNLPGKAVLSAFKQKSNYWSELPRWLENRVKYFRSLGSEYLNVEFGWKPFVGDLQKTYEVWSVIDKFMARLIRENGKWVRKRATIQNDVTVNTDQAGVFNLGLHLIEGRPIDNVFRSGSTQWAVTVTRRDKIWFEGSFRYWIPDTSSSLWTTKARAVLFGALPTPEAVWSVMPWSWLIDWFSNWGDVLSNLSPNAVDNLVMRYGYLMRTVTTETEAWAHTTVENEAHASDWQEWPRIPSASFYSNRKVVEKIRVTGGNPFGLDYNLPDLSSRQIAILAALGISRV